MKEFPQPISAPDHPPEPSRESAHTRREILEKAGEGRRKLFENISASRIKEIARSRTADIAGNLIPGIDIPKLFAEAWRGKTSSGEELSRRQRFAYTAVAGGISMAYALELSGLTGGALTARAAAGAIAKIELGPETLKEIAERSKKRFPKQAALLEKTANFLLDKREAFYSVFGAGRAATEERFLPEKRYD